MSKSGKIILLGDSAHPFLPTSTQGASQTIEDSATIALCLHAAGERNVPLATRTWEKIRYERVKTAQKAGETQRDKWHNAHSEAEKSGEFNKSQELDTVVLWNQYVTGLESANCSDAELEFGQRWDEVSRQVRENMSVKVS